MHLEQSVLLDHVMIQFVELLLIGLRQICPQILQVALGLVNKILVGLQMSFILNLPEILKCFLFLLLQTSTS